MKTESKESKKFFLLIALILLLVTSTYAWFTVNRNVRVEGINVEVATSGNLEISVDAINWKNVINTNELLNSVKNTYPAAVNQIPSEGLYPMSTAGNIANGKLDMFFGKVLVDADTNAYSLITSKEEETHGTDGKFISFDIFLKVEHQTVVYLTSESEIKSSRITNNNLSTGIENATRIAVLNHGNGSSAAQVQNLKGANKAMIIEPNYDAHTNTGIRNAQDIYQIYGLSSSGSAALQYYGVKANISNPVAINSKSDAYFAIVNPDKKLARSFFNGGNQVEVLNLNPGITKLRLYIWIEGQDVDCEDNASGANLTVNLQFST